MVALVRELAVPSAPPSAAATPQLSPRLRAPSGGSSLSDGSLAAALAVVPDLDTEPARTTFQAAQKKIVHRHGSQATEDPSGAALTTPTNDDDDAGDDDGGVAQACVAMQALRNLSQTKRLRGRLLCGAVGAVGAALRCASLGAAAGEDALTQCAAFLANLSEEPGGRAGLVKAVLGVPALCTLARAPFRDARLDAARALCNLSCVEDNAEALYSQGGFRTLVDVVVGGRDAADRQQVR